MAFNVSTRQAGKVAIVDLSGKITLGEGSGSLRSAIKELVSAGERSILVNLSDVTYLDSAGLGELVGTYATVTNLGGDIKLLRPQGKVKDLLAVTKLYTVFVTFEDEAAALASFGGDAAGA